MEIDSALSRISMTEEITAGRTTAAAAGLKLIGDGAETEICNDNKATSFRFLSLPPEIRNLVYTFIFVDAKLGIATVHTKGPPCRKTFCTCTYPLALTTTCRLLRSETLHLLCAVTTLEITNRIDKTHLLPDQLLGAIQRAVILDTKQFSALSQMPLARFQNLQVLELRNVPVWCRYHPESYLETAAADQPMASLAMYNLSRISPALYDLCGAGERKFKVLLGCSFVGNSTTHRTLHAVVNVDTGEVFAKSRGATHPDRNEWAGLY